MVVNLSDIEMVHKSYLENKKLYALENSYDSFETQLNSKSEPIALDCTSKPYKIINGRHRIYLARVKGYTTVNANYI